jgi:hypothetical protein
VPTTSFALPDSLASERWLFLLVLRPLQTCLFASPSVPSVPLRFWHVPMRSLSDCLMTVATPMSWAGGHGGAETKTLILQERR